MVQSGLLVSYLHRRQGHQVKFSDEELSRILGEHEAGRLKRYGSYGWQDIHDGGLCCVNQAAFNEGDHWVAAARRVESYQWFDNMYDRAWSADEFLARLEKQGLA